MIYQEDTPISAIALGDLRESVGWNRMEQCYNDPLLTLYYHVAVYDEDRLVGYIDCISNGVPDAYIQDLIVHPDYQNMGIGTKLMNRFYLKSKIYT